MPEQQILGASWLVPIDNEIMQQTGCITNGWLRDYAILIDQGLIRAVDSFQQLREKHPQIETAFLDNHILLPGLINCHSHSGMSLLRGYDDDNALQAWLNQSIWPLEASWLSDEFVTAGSELAIAEMLLAGTTTFSDMYFFPTATAQVAQRAGIRAQINFPVFERANNWASDADQHIALGLNALDQYRQNDRIDIGFAPHAPYTVDDSTFSRIVTLAEEVDARIQIHLQETAIEIQNSIKQYGVTPTQRLHQLDVLSARTQAVHLTHFNESDLALLKETSTSVIHCPSSNLKLASGYCDISSLLDHKITVGLGSDSAASNNTLSSFDSIRQALLLTKHHTQNTSQISALDALTLATLGSARALGIDTLTGSIKPGKQADIIAVDCSQPSMQPVHNPVSQLAYTNCAATVNHLWVAGQQLVKNRQLLTLDQQQIVHQTQLWQKKIQAY